MTSMKHPNTTLFSAILMSVFLLFSRATVQGSLLEGEDREAKIQFAVETYSTELELDLSRFETLNKKKRGSDNQEQYEAAEVIFNQIAEQRNGIIEAMNLMRKEEGANELALTTLRFIDLSDHKGHPHEFQPGLGWNTILMKLTLLHKSLPGLRENLVKAFDEHKRLKATSLKKDYSALANQALKDTAGFKDINAFYVKPKALVPEDVSDDGLDTLKQKVSDFEGAVLKHSLELTKAKQWQKDFNAHQKKYVLLAAEQEKLASAFSVLEKAKADNPHLKVVADLEPLADEGDLSIIKGTLDDIVEAQRVLTEALAQGQLWQKDFVLHEKTYVLLAAEQEKLRAAFQVLREADDKNPHLKAVEDLPAIAGEGDLSIIKGTLDDIVEAQRLLNESLGLAKTWKPEEVVVDEL